MDSDCSACERGLFETVVYAARTPLQATVRIGRIAQGENRGRAYAYWEKAGFFGLGAASGYALIPEEMAADGYVGTVALLTFLGLSREIKKARDNYWPV